jgi:hypothetical protein
MRILGTLVGCLLAVSLTACGGSTKTVTETVTTTVTETAAAEEPTTTEETAPVSDGTTGTTGQSLTLPESGLTIRLLSVKRGVSADDSSDNFQLSDGKRDPSTHEFVKIEIHAKLGAEYEKLFFFGFSLIDSKDRSYDEIDQAPAVFEPHITGENLQPGDKVSGVVGFVVPKKVKIVGVRYSDVNGDAVTWTVDK